MHAHFKSPKLSAHQMARAGVAAQLLRAARPSNGSPPYSDRCPCHPRHHGSSQLRTRALFLRPLFTPYAVCQASQSSRTTPRPQHRNSSTLWKQPCASSMTVEGFTETLKEAFGVDASKFFANKSELAQLIATWEESKIQSETKTKVDAVAQALGEHHEMFQTEIRCEHSRILFSPASLYFEAFDEKVNEGRLRPETLSQVVSLE